MNIIETNTETMKSDTGTISGYISNLRNASKAIEGIIGTLSGSWEGEAATAYETRLRNDVTKLNELIDAVSELNQGTQNAGTRYEQCENNVADIISSINV